MILGKYTFIMVDYEQLEEDLLELEEVSEVEMYENSDGMVVVVTYSESKDEYIRLGRLGVSPSYAIYDVMENAGVPLPVGNHAYGVQFDGPTVKLSSVVEK